MLENLLDLVILVILGSMTFFIKQLYSNVTVLFDKQKELFVNGEDGLSFEEIMSGYENERDKEFNDKIRGLEEKLGSTIADELHPLVVNIPHEDVVIKPAVQEEYAE